MKTNYYLKKKILDTLVFICFLAGSYIIYWKVGKWVAIGVALEILAVYLWIYIDFKLKDGEIKKTQDNADS